MTVFDTSALTRPILTAALFIATKWDSAAEKAAFANALCRFVGADFKKPLLYRRLALSFGHVAHSPAPSQTSAPFLHRGVPPKTRRSVQQSGQTSLF